MILVVNVSVLDSRAIPEPSEIEITEGKKRKPSPGDPTHEGTILVKKLKRTKGGSRIPVEDLQSFKSYGPVPVGDLSAEIEIDAYAVDGKKGLSVKIIKILKTKPQA